MHNAAVAARQTSRPLTVAERTLNGGWLTCNDPTTPLNRSETGSWDAALPARFHRPHKALPRALGDLGQAMPIEMNGRLTAACGQLLLGGFVRTAEAARTRNPIQLEAEFN